MLGIWSRTECYEVPLDRSLGLTWPESCSARMFCTPFVSSVGTWWTCFPRKLQLNTKVLKQVSRHIKMQKININHSYNHMKLLRWGAAPTRHPRSEIQVSNGGLAIQNECATPSALPLLGLPWTSSTPHLLSLSRQKLQWCQIFVHIWPSSLF